MKANSSQMIESLGVNGELVNNVQVLDHIAEFFEGEHAVVVSITLDDGAVNKLLKLYISEVGTHHHFKYSE